MTLNIKTSDIHGTSTCLFEMKLDINEILHSNLIDIIDDVLVVVQGEASRIVYSCVFALTGGHNQSIGSEKGKETSVL